MNKGFHFIALGIFGCLLIALLVSRASRAPLPAQAQELVAQPEVTPVTPVENLTGQAAYESQTQTRIRELSGLQREQEMRQRAAAKTGSAREVLQRLKAAQWLGVLTSNWPAFLLLREQAGHAPTGETPCTLCDGAGYMHYCVLCADSHGKCITCQGKGSLPSNELCPTCLGTAKCYLCFGTGRMSCPFCNDGMISRRWRMPPNNMPVD